MNTNQIQQLNIKSNVVSLNVNQDQIKLNGNFAQSFIDTFTSEDSKRTYSNTLKEFFNVSSLSYIKLHRVQSIFGTQVQDYITKISTKNKSNTVNNKISHLKSFIDYINFLGMSCNIEIPNIFANKYLKKLANNNTSKDNKEIDTFKPHEITAILNETKKYHNHRDYVLLRFMFNSMARRDEIVNIYPEDIFTTTNDKGVTEYGVILNGKGRKQRKIYITEEMKQLLDSITFSANCPIFHITGDAIYKILNKYCRKAGIVKQRISPHIARHSGVTIANDLGADAKDIQSTVGHSDNKTTEGYIHDTKKFEKSATRFLDFK